MRIFTKDSGEQLVPTSDRTFEGVFSTSAPDCESDVLEGWSFEPEIPLYWLHNRDARIGTAYPRLDAGRLVGKGELYTAAHSDETAKAIGLLRGVGAGLSIGFFPAAFPEKRAGAGYHYPAVRVVELSMTPPGQACCRDCGVQPAKAKASNSWPGGLPPQSQYDPMEDVREYARQVREDMAAAQPKPGQLAPHWLPQLVEQLNAHRLQEKLTRQRDSYRKALGEI